MISRAGSVRILMWKLIAYDAFIMSDFARICFHGMPRRNGRLCLENAGLGISCRLLQCYLHLAIARSMALEFPFLGDAYR